MLSRLEECRMNSIDLVSQNDSAYDTNNDAFYNSEINSTDGQHLVRIECIRRCETCIVSYTLCCGGMNGERCENS